MVGRTKGHLPPYGHPYPPFQAERCICTSINYTTEYVTTTSLFTVAFTIGPQFLVCFFSYHSEIYIHKHFTCWKRSTWKAIYSYPFFYFYPCLLNNQEVRPLCKLGLNTWPSVTSSRCHFVHCQQMVSFFYWWITRTSVLCTPVTDRLSISTVLLVN